MRRTFYVRLIRKSHSTPEEEQLIEENYRWWTCMACIRRGEAYLQLGPMSAVIGGYSGWYSAAVTVFAYWGIEIGMM